MTLIQRTTLSVALLGISIPSIVSAQDDVTRPIFWEIQAVDAMKYSRDVAREKLNNKAYDTIIENQTKVIAESGATHIAIGTPYDAEFLPFLKRWVDAARRHNLNVWFRGNWSGWEGWFEYDKITRTQHQAKTKEFILRNRALFEDGDVFVACPECENGGPGDPRNNNDLKGHRTFLINEHKMMEAAFKEIGKDVDFNMNSMNGDVARLVMDKETTKALGGVIAIDHYVKTKEKLVADIKQLASEREAKIMLAEFGAPIPDIHGNLNETAQAKWIYEALNEVAKFPEVIGVNYWVGFGGSTALWNPQTYAPKLGAEVLGSVFNPPAVSGTLKDKLDRPITKARIKNEYGETMSDDKGKFTLPYLEETGRTIYIYADNHHDMVTTIGKDEADKIITLERSEPTLGYRLLLLIRTVKEFFLNLLDLSN